MQYIYIYRHIIHIIHIYIYIHRIIQVVFTGAKAFDDLVKLSKDRASGNDCYIGNWNMAKEMTRVFPF